MKEYDYKKLQNGSDIRGIAMEGARGEHINLGAEETARLTRGFAMHLAKKLARPVAGLAISVGHDSRLTGEKLKNIIIETLVSLGITVYDCGLASTPAMFMSTIFPEYDCDGAIMITASHLPYNRNGFKYFGKDGGLDKSDISQIIAYAESDAACDAACDAAAEKVGKETGAGAKAAEKVGQEPGAGAKHAEKRDLIERYSRHLREKIIAETAEEAGSDTEANAGASAGAGPGAAGAGMEGCSSAGMGRCSSAGRAEKPLAGLKIVVDAGNGAGGFYAEKILAPLGADVSASQFLEPDGHFPNHQPNPENREAMESISKRVIESGADLGLIFDTDVDRASAVDRNGKEISRNAIVAMAAALIAREHPGTTVVTDSITSDELTVYLEKCLGLKHLRYRRGYKNVINKAIELNEFGTDCQLAIETSGHAAYKENYFLDDGAYLATKIVIKAAQLAKSGAGIDVLLSSLEEPKEAIEIRFPLRGEDFAERGERILSDLAAWAKEKPQAGDGIWLAEPNYEGVRLNFRMAEATGWCLLRKSLHDPIMPLNIEVSEGSCEKILSIIKDFLRKYEEVEI